MISSAERFEYTNCNISPTGDDFDSSLVPTLEQWLNINEMVRYLEVAASILPSQRSARYTLGTGVKDDVSSVVIPRSKLEDYISRINAALSVEYFNTSLRTDTLKQVDGYYISGATAGLPSMSATEITSQFSTNRRTNGSISITPGVSVSRDDFLSIRTACRKTLTVGRIIDVDPKLGLSYGTYQWYRNGVRSVSPDAETPGGLYPFGKSSTVINHTASFYYHVQFSSEANGSVDYTYTRECSNPYYNFPTVPFRYSEQDSLLDRPHILCSPIYACWRASIWEGNHTGSSLKILEYGDKGTAKFIFPTLGAYYHEMIGAPFEFNNSVQEIGSYCEGRMGTTSYRPDMVRPVMENLRRVGWATYVEPIAAYYQISPHMRYLDK